MRKILNEVKAKIHITLTEQKLYDLLENLGDTPFRGKTDVDDVKIVKGRDTRFIIIFYVTYQVRGGWTSDLLRKFNRRLEAIKTSARVSEENVEILTRTPLE